MSETWLTPRDVSLAVLQSHLPLGKAWNGFRIAGKVAYQFLKGLARTHQDAWRFLASLPTQIDYRTSTQLVEEWETAVGLPDKCLPRAGTLAERRAWIAFRLNKTRWNTIADWHALAALFGLNVRIVPGYVVQRPALYAEYYPRPYYEFPKLGRFRVYIDILEQPRGGYPYDASSVEDHKYPIPYGLAYQANSFQCLLEKVAPANVLILWNKFPPVPPNGTGYTFTDDFDTEFS